VGGGGNFEEKNSRTRSSISKEKHVAHRNKISGTNRRKNDGESSTAKIKTDYYKPGFYRGRSGVTTLGGGWHINQARKGDEKRKKKKKNGESALRKVTKAPDDKKKCALLVKGASMETRRKRPGTCQQMRGKGKRKPQRGGNCGPSGPKGSVRENDRGREGAPELRGSRGGDPELKGRPTNQTHYKSRPVKRPATGYDDPQTTMDFPNDTNLIIH